MALNSVPGRCRSGKLIKRLTGREEAAIRGIDVGQWEDDGTEEVDRICKQVTEETEGRGEMVS